MQNNDGKTLIVYFWSLGAFYLIEILKIISLVSCITQ